VKKLIWLIFLIPILASAGEVNRVVTIDRILSFTADRPNVPASQNITRVYVNEAAWGSSSCRQDAADLIKEDEHTYSLILMAWASGKSLKIGVDDRRRPYDSVCKIVWVEAT